MYIISVKKYFATITLALVSLGAGQVTHAAAVKMLQGFPYKPLWDLAVTAKKRGVNHVATTLAKPSVAAYAVPGTIAYVVWLYCELALWKLEREKTRLLEDGMDAAFPNPVAPKKRLNRNQSEALNRRRELLPELKKRSWYLWLAKWVSLGLGSLALMKTYKVWPKNSLIDYRIGE